ncbi:DUF4286 family protein [Facilibium subflavum]|uniref:DUF4286 family protein n=1 Tax=Facilibium subflavum TaxID=2219058 RepID=UPI000E64737B|nr:DUF4286 family protein [Facilibium subflavum]
MILYQVNLEVDKGIAERYLTWLNHHKDEMLKFKGFIDANIYLDQQQTKQDQLTLSVIYQIISMDELNEYFRIHAKAMQEEGIARFGGRFHASRRILRPYNDEKAPPSPD